MRPLRIESALKLSVAEIDSQHQELVDLANQTQLIIDDGGHPVSLIRMLDEFNELTIRHFCTEEMLMKDAGYPAYQAHKQMHDVLIKKTFGFDASSLLGDIGAAKDLVALMREWLLDHIEADRDVANYLKERQSV